MHTVKRGTLHSQDTYFDAWPDLRHRSAVRLGARAALGLLPGLALGGVFGWPTKAQAQLQPAIQAERAAVPTDPKPAPPSAASPKVLPGQADDPELSPAARRRAEVPRHVAKYNQGKILFAIGLGVFGGTYLPLVIGNSLVRPVNGCYYVPGSPIALAVQFWQMADAGNKSNSGGYYDGVGIGLAGAAGALVMLWGLVQVGSLITAISGLTLWTDHSDAGGRPTRRVSLVPRFGATDLGIGVAGQL